MTKIAPETQQTSAEGPLFAVAQVAAETEEVNDPLNNRSPRVNNLALFRALFGPGAWRDKAARILGVSACMVSLMAHGRRLISARHWAVMQAYAGRREVNILTEHRRRLAEVDEVYRKALVDLVAARRVLEARQGRRSRDGR